MLWGALWKLPQHSFSFSYTHVGLCCPFPLTPEHLVLCRRAKPLPRLGTDSGGLGLPVTPQQCMSIFVCSQNWRLEFLFRPPGSTFVLQNVISENLGSISKELKRNSSNLEEAVRRQQRKLNEGERGFLQGVRSFGVD